MFRTETGRNCLSLCINPILGETFVACLSILIPSNLVQEHCVKSCPSSLILILEMFKSILSCNYAKYKSWSQTSDYDWSSKDVKIK